MFLRFLTVSNKSTKNCSTRSESSLTTNGLMTRTTSCLTRRIELGSTTSSQTSASDSYTPTLCTKISSSDFVVFSHSESMSQQERQNVAAMYVKMRKPHLDLIEA